MANLFILKDIPVFCDLLCFHRHSGFVPEPQKLSALFSTTFRLRLPKKRVPTLSAELTVGSRRLTVESLPAGATEDTELSRPPIDCRIHHPKPRIIAPRSGFSRQLSAVSSNPPSVHR